MKRITRIALSIMVVALLSPMAWSQDQAAAPTDTPAVDQAAPAPEPTTPPVIATPPADTAPPATVAPAPVAAQPGPKAKDFQDQLEKLKAVLEKVGELKREYLTADDDRKAQILKEYEEIINKGAAIQDALTSSAIEAYKEAPNADDEVTRYLLGVLSYQLAMDDYENALELSKLLIDKGTAQKLIDSEDPGMQGDGYRIYGVAGKAAFATNNFDDAEKWLKMADEKGVLQPEEQAYIKQIPGFKEKWAKESEIRKKEAEANDLPRVLLSTNKGDITIELFENEAPNTVANFVSLVEKGYYEDVPFHRVLEGFMAQGGDPTGTGGGGPGYCIKDETGKAYPNARDHFRGSLSMAKTQMPDTGGSQFFLTFVPTPFLDGVHTVFGRVVDGMDVLAKIQRRDPESDAAPDPDYIVKAKVLRKRNHEYKPETLPER